MEGSYRRDSSYGFCNWTSGDVLDPTRCERPLTFPLWAMPCPEFPAELGAACAQALLTLCQISESAGSAAVSGVLCSAVLDSILRPAAQGMPHLEKAERDATLAAVAASLPTALELLQHWLSLAPEVPMHALPRIMGRCSMFD
jgi:hypothetical protein